MQQMAAMESRAPLLYGSPPQAPGANTESSSIPHDAIQAEVARQLAGLKQELENQRARADHAEVRADQAKALLRTQVADHVRSANAQPVGLGPVSGFGMDVRLVQGCPVFLSQIPQCPKHPQVPVLELDLPRPKPSTCRGITGFSRSFVRAHRW